MDMSGMSGMDMSGMTMDMPSSTATASASAATATGDSMAGMDMGGMTMHEYFTPNYHGYPVVFKTLSASSGAAAFGIFCVIFFTCFAFRGLMFLGAYMEQRVFHNYTNTVIVEQADCACDPESSEADTKEVTAHTTSPAGSFGQKLRLLLFPGMHEVGKDIVRLVIAFLVAMFGYALMLAAMSFVLLYFFAVCLGLAFSEVFFNRLAMVLGINRSAGPCSALH